MSRDMAGGWGPIEYLIRNSLPGIYIVSVKLFSASGKALAYVACWDLSSDKTAELELPP